MVAIAQTNKRDLDMHNFMPCSDGRWYTRADALLGIEGIHVIRTIQNGECSGVTGRTVWPGGAPGKGEGLGRESDCRDLVFCRKAFMFNARGTR